MLSLRFENNLLTVEAVRFASISKKTPLSKLSFAFVSLALPLIDRDIRNQSTHRGASGRDTSRARRKVKLEKREGTKTHKFTKDKRGCKGNNRKVR